MKNFRVDIMAVIMKSFLKELGVELDGKTTEDNFVIMNNLASDFENKEILEFLTDIEERGLKETFFRVRE